MRHLNKAFFEPLFLHQVETHHVTISTRYTVDHFLGYGRRYSIDYRFPIASNTACTPKTSIAQGRVEEVSLAAGVELFISDLDVLRPYQSFSKGNTDLLIVVMLEGCAHFDIDGQKRWITAGEACWLRLDTGLTLSAFHPANQRLRTLCLSLDAPAMQAWYGSYISSTAPHVWQLSPGLQLTIDEACCASSSAESQRMRFQGLALQIIAQGLDCRSPYTTESGALYRQRLALVRRWLDEEPSFDHTLQLLADRAAMSPSTLMRHFKMAYGLAPIDYLRKRRLALARELLLSGHSVQQAAHLSGYRHASNFITAFKKNYGISPGALTESSLERS
ncbi:AraC family transcriptional regulator [Vreelandella venusta]|nr:AraC family transcriptional regulator [Halomonas venusta]